MTKKLYFAQLLFDTNNPDNQNRPVLFKTFDTMIATEDHNSYYTEDENADRCSTDMKYYEYTGPTILSSVNSSHAQTKQFVSDPALLPELKQYLLDQQFFGAIRRYESAVAAHDFFFNENDLEERLLVEILRTFQEFQEELDDFSNLKPENMLLYCTLVRSENIKRESIIFPSVELMWISEEDEGLNQFTLMDRTLTPITEVTRNLGDVEVGTHHHPYVSVCLRPGMDIVPAVRKMKEAMAITVKEHVQFEKKMMDRFLEALRNVKL